MRRNTLRSASKYLLAFTVPVLLVGILLIWYDYLYSRQEGQRIAASSLQQIAEINDALINSCESLLESASSDEELAGALADENVEYLSAWIRANEAVGMFPVRIALYRRASTDIITGSGRVSYASFESEVNALSASLAGMFTKLNNSIGMSMATLYKQDDDPYGFALFQPIMDDELRVGTICILVSNQTIADLMNVFFSTDHVSLAILDSTRSPLYFSSSCNVPVSVLRSMRSTLQTVTLDRSEHLLFRYISQKTRLLYYLSVPSSSLYGNQLRWMLYLMIGLCAVTSGILSLIIAFMHQRKLLVADSRNEALSNRLNENTQVIRDLVLQRILDGSIQDRKQFEYSISCAGIVFDKPFFQVAMLRLKNEDSSGNELLQTDRILTNASNSQISCQCCLNSSDDQYFVIMNSEKQDPEYARRFLLHVWPSLSPYVGGCGLSTVFEDPMRMNQGVIESIVAFNENMNTQNGISVYAPENSDSQYSLKSISHEKNYITECLKNGNEELLLTALRELLDKIRTSGNSAEYTKCCYYDIINMLITQASEYGTSINEKILQSASLHDIPASLDDLIAEEFAKLCRISVMKQEEKAKKSKYNLMNYVLANFTDPDLSLTSISEETGLSSAYISRLFKEETGSTFVSYVRYQRIQYARKLLDSTDRFIKDIATECGFVDQTSFIRCFKATEGITPSDYRKQKKITENIQ